MFGVIFGNIRHEGAQHPRCRFPERFYFLKKELGIVEESLPPVRCPLYDEWREKVRIESVSLIFASFYINNPASLFGHTFLKWNRQGSRGDDELLDFGLNFAANATTDNAILYGIYGVFGGFPGVYTLFPYYFKVNEYNDWENRDIWEYPLNLNQEEIERMVRHSWELGSTHFNYYYFDENCSYQILTLLEVARPSLNLSDYYILSVQPLDTVKVAVRQNKLLREKPRLRLSAFGRLRSRIEKLSEKERKLYFKLYPTYSLPPEDIPLESRIALIDTLMDDYFFRYYGEKEIDPAKKKNYEILLKERSRLKIKRENQEPEEGEDPSLGHDSTTWRLSYLYHSQVQGFDVLFRPALRELVDPPFGYSPYAAISMFALNLRFFPTERIYPYFEKLILAEVFSLSPMRAYYLKPSWGLLFSLESLQRRYQEDKFHDKVAFVGQLGAGASYGEKPFTLFLLPVIRSELSAAIAHFWDPSVGVLAGILARIATRLSFLWQLSSRYYFRAKEKIFLEFLSQVNLALQRNLALEASYHRAVARLKSPMLFQEEILFSLKIYR
ncbi:MAG: DUF4105 domain-containing protein [Leptospiraceae bacterium]|nr:DUF4105 domain-containing protein [Leptospiraceae bacterium]MDW8307210.1 DUF4105 domain-containing protein [Leptospiraceae bacterium]